MLKLRNSSFFLIIFVFVSCETNINNYPQEPTNQLDVLDTFSIKNTLIIFDSVEVSSQTNFFSIAFFDNDSITLDQYLQRFGLVDVQDIIPNAQVDLKYSSTDNFVGIDMYGDLEKAYFQPDVAKKLKKAYNYLQEEDSMLTLLIFDAVRPVFIQQKMWDTMKMPMNEKTKFLSNPINHSIHNYGAAVDISLTTKDGHELDMGTHFDFFGKLAYPREEQKLLKQGKLTQKHIENRKLLRKVMKKAGFFNIQTEWWHWNSCSRNTAKRRYKVVR
jgi:zinc D-Ala-D-Ala dipeptidase